MTTINHFPVMPEHGTTKGNAPLSGEAQGQTNMPNDTTLDALVGWFGLGVNVNVKQSKTRQQKKSWIRGGTR